MLGGEREEKVWVVKTTQGRQPWAKASLAQSADRAWNRNPIVGGSLFILNTALSACCSRFSNTLPNLMKNIRRWFRLMVVLVLLAPVAGRAQAEVTGIYLTWSDDPATTMTVNWLSLYAEAPETVWYRHGTGEWSRADGASKPLPPSGLWVRRAQLSGLQPDTVYEMAIAATAPEGPRGVNTFRTMPSELRRAVTFVTGGDMMHTREMVDIMNKQAGRLDPDFALFGGDLAYDDNVNATRLMDFYQSWMQNGRGRDGRLIPIVAVIGNHEVQRGYRGRPEVEASYFYTMFEFPGGKARHVLDFGTYLSLVNLDSEHTEAIQGEQAAWLGETLAARAGQTFLFACYHFPAYGTAKAPGPGTLPIDNPRSIAIREHWMPHLERWGVTAVFENDHHNFKRTHRLRGHRRDDENGLLYLGDGAWGVRTRTVPSLSEAWYLAKAEPTRHLFHVVMQPSGRARITAVNDQGEIFDEVNLFAPRTRPVHP
jgi:hypothetical protein